jgi:hypothetical protein
MKKKKLVEKALSNPHLYSEGEIGYFRLWLKHREMKKQRKRELRKLRLEQTFLQ